MKALSYIFSGLLAVISLQGMDSGNTTLFDLSIKQLEKQGVYNYAEQLHSLSEHQSFAALCVTLLKSNTFTVDEKLELVELLNNGSDDDLNTSYGSMNSDIDMYSDSDFLMNDTTARFHNTCYQDMVQALTAMFQHRERVTINTPGFDDRRLLHMVALTNDVTYANQRSLVQLLLSMGASCLVRDIHGCTPLHDAVSSLSVGVVQDLLQQVEGLESVHVGNAKGKAPLHVVLNAILHTPAAYHAEDIEKVKQIVELLCQAGADILAKDKQQESPMSIAQAIDMMTNTGMVILLRTYSKIRN